MSDRAQLDGGNSHLVGFAIIGVVVLGLVVDAAVSELPAPGDVSDVCLGVCGCGACPTWWHALPIIAGLVLVANWVINPSMPQSAEEGDE